jgi:hypothetical protein
MPWTIEPSLANPRSGLAAAVCDAPSPEFGYRIYAIGGNDGAGPFAAVEAYDTLARAWTSVAPLPTARVNLAATSGPGRLYSLGGSDGDGPLATHEIYDPAAGTWASAPPLPTARSGPAAVTGRDGLVYVLGGFNGDYLSTVEVFDPGTNAWSTVSSMPTARQHLAAVTGPDGLIYAIGGENATGILNFVEVFNPLTHSWTTGPSLPDARSTLAAAVGADGRIYVVGGYDQDGNPQGTLYSYDPATGAWTAGTSLLMPQAFLAAVTGPDGLIYAIGGMDAESLSAVEAFTLATASTAPDPYIGNGTYQTPDIILLDASNNPVPIGDAPSGAWDTLLQPNTYYGIQAVVYNDSKVAAPNTVVRFWSFSGGVGTTGSLIDLQMVTVPANGSIVVSSAKPFQSGAAGTHECVAVSIANHASANFATDPTTATEVIDPAVAHPAGSGHFGSAWRNTNSIVMFAGSGWILPFHANIAGDEAVRATIAVTASKVPARWDRAGEPAQLRRALERTGADLRLPLFLLPSLRSRLAAAHDELNIKLRDERNEADSQGKLERPLTVRPGRNTRFTVAGTIPSDARTGDIFLINVAAHYPRTARSREAVVEYLEVIYVKS